LIRFNHATIAVPALLPQAQSLLFNCCFPNPANDFFEMNFYLQTQSDVKITLYNHLGQELKILQNANYFAGNYSLAQYTGSLNNGIYWIKAELLMGAFNRLCS